jgi:ribosomal protein L37AE/L43A
MDVTEKDVGFEGHFGEQLASEQANPRASVQDQQRASAANLDAARVATDFDGVGAWNCNTPANTPEGNAHSGKILLTLLANDERSMLRRCFME